MREAARELAGEPRGVVGHLDVEHADQLLALGIDRDARGADLLAEDRQRVVGQRIDVGDLRIADRDVDEAAYRCARPPTCRSKRSPSTVRCCRAIWIVRDSAHSASPIMPQRSIAATAQWPARIARSRSQLPRFVCPVRRPPAEAGADIVVLIHDTLPHPS